MTRRAWTAALAASHPAPKRIRPKPDRPDETTIPPVQVVDIVMMGKPRMTQRDKWVQRRCVVRYRTLCDELRLACLKLPEEYVAIVYLPMLAKWSDEEKRTMNGTPHRVEPDRDNIDKALMDALAPGDDARFHDGRMLKRWAYTGRLVILKYPMSASSATLVRKYLPPAPHA